jgi:glycyl-tRNA synthetase
MEIEYFIRAKDWEKTFEYWKSEMQKWAVEILGLKKENVRVREHAKEELSHYSKRTIDFEYNFPFGGFKELYGLAYRTDFDLKAHQKASGQDMSYFDEAAKEKFIPHVVEPTFGVDRSILAVLADGFEIIKGARTTTTEAAKEEEVVLRLAPRLAPIKAAILPLVKKEPLKKLAEKIYRDLREEWMVQYDETGSVGRRYRRQDEIGTPFCITVDFDSLEDNAVTVRDRDTMKQERIKIAELIDYLEEKLV